MSNLERTTSLPARMDEMRRGEEDFTLPRHQLRRSSSMPVAEGRMRSAREFPPPLGSLARKSAGGTGQMVPLTRLRSVRSNGRIVLHEVKIANQMTLHTVRHQGRLLLNLVRCKENTPPSSSSSSSSSSEAPVVAEAEQSPNDDHRIEDEVEKAEEVVNKDDSESKFRADHAHVLQELMAAYAARVVKQMSCNRPVVWDHNHHFHCVTTSS